VKDIQGGVGEYEEKKKNQALILKFELYWVEEGFLEESVADRSDRNPPITRFVKNFGQRRKKGRGFTNPFILFSRSG